MARKTTGRNGAQAVREMNHGINMLRQYFKKGDMVYGVTVKYTKAGVRHIRALTINEGHIIDVGLYVSNARGIRRTEDGALVGTNRTIEDIAADIALALGLQCGDIKAARL